MFYKLTENISLIEKIRYEQHVGSGATGLVAFERGGSLTGEHFFVLTSSQLAVESALYGLDDSGIIDSQLGFESFLTLVGLKSIASGTIISGYPGV